MPAISYWLMTVAKRLCSEHGRFFQTQIGGYSKRETVSTRTVRWDGWNRADG
jgi:hypothetical protein